MKKELKNNSKIILPGDFPEDGLYKLRVQANDRTQNNSGSFDYIIGFEVINRSTITNILNYPNPFTSSTAITFNVNTATQVKVTLTNVEGKEIAVLLDEFTAAGVKTIEYNNADLQRGIYFYTLYMDEEKHTRKMVKE